MYLLFEEKPIGEIEISKNNYIEPFKCLEGWLIHSEFKQLCIDNKWIAFTEVNENEITFPNDQP
jgi:hypothetical protein